jgi:alanyl-tRNA synthetase
LSECKQIYEGIKVLDKECISSSSDGQITGDIAFKLYESHGFKEADIEKLAKIKGMNADC